VLAKVVFELSAVPTFTFRPGGWGFGGREVCALMREPSVLAVEVSYPVKPERQARR
jgi:hypothetical protein